jgi:acetoin utilization protein AcuB
MRSCLGEEQEDIVMTEKLQIQAVMHPFPHTIGSKQSLKIARNMMTEHKIRHLPVKTGGELVGIITERDIDFALRVDKKTPEEMSVEEAFTAEPYTVVATTPVETIARKMAHDHIGCALVIDSKDQLIGIFTTVDACRALAEVLSGTKEQ